MTQDGTTGNSQPAEQNRFGMSALTGASAGVGAELRAAREAQSLSLAHVAGQTRIPTRHIEMIERGAFHELPARTYAVGFTRTYAKLLGLDELDLVNRVREELDSRAPERPVYTAAFEPADPERTPSSRLFWFAVLGAVVIVAAAAFFMRNMFTPAAELPSLVAQQEAEQAAAQEAAGDAAATNAAPAANPTGDVVFTALEEGIWVKFYDAAGLQLMQKQMAKGETYTIPADAEGPKVWTGRPDALSITIGGKNVAPLATEQKIMRDVPVDAQSLNARAAPAVAPAAGPAGTPAVSPASSTGAATAP